MARAKNQRFKFEVLVKVDQNHDFIDNINVDKQRWSIENMIKEAISEYCLNCSDAVIQTGDADDDSTWIAATDPQVTVKWQPPTAAEV